MIQVSRYIKKHFIVLTLWLILVFYYCGRYALRCKVYPHLSFDFQALLTWDYSSSLNYLPYKDIFYPYGLLFYFNNTNIFFNIFYFLIPPILYIVFYLLFQTITKQKIISLIGIVFFFFFIEQFIQHEVFTRYGILATLICIYAYFLAGKQKKQTKYAFIEGGLTGLVFSIITDAGIYAGLLYIIFQFVSPFLTYTKNKDLLSTYQKIIKKLIRYFFGFIIGSVPFLYYLFSKGVFNDFIISLYRLSDITLYAKTPFIPYAFSIENIFTIGILLFTILNLSVKIILVKKKLNLLEYLQLGLIMVLVLLEQKSIIRSLDKLLVFLSVLLFLFLLYELIVYLQHKKVYNPILYLLSILMLSAVFFGIGFIPVSLPVSGNISSRKCVNDNSDSLTNNKPAYKKVKAFLDKEKDFNGKVFSFPGDPIFYILFKIKPPYYFSSYESTPLYAQKKQVEYLKENDPSFMIYNLSLPSIQDDIPHYVRNTELFKYILHNYSPYNRIENFLLLKRNKKSGEGAITVYLNTDNPLRKYLLNINLENIPRTEGKYKSDVLKKSKLLIKNVHIAEFNNLLKKNTISSKNTFLVVSNNTKNKRTSVTFNSENLTSTVSYNTCNSPSLCIINISNIPLFYNSKRIEKINSNDIHAEFTLIETKETALW